MIITINWLKSSDNKPKQLTGKLRMELFSVKSLSAYLDWAVILESDLQYKILSEARNNPNIGGIREKKLQQMWWTLMKPKMSSLNQGPTQKR